VGARGNVGFICSPTFAFDVATTKAGVKEGKGCPIRIKQEGLH